MTTSTASNPDDNKKINGKTTTQGNSIALQLSSVKKSREMKNNQIRRARVNSRSSKGELRLAIMIREMRKKTALEEEKEEVAADEEEMSSGSFLRRIQQSRRFILHIFNKPAFHYTIIILIIVDLIDVFIDLVFALLSSPCLAEDEMELYNTTIQRSECLLYRSSALIGGEHFLYYVSLIILSIFVLEISVSFYAFGWRRYIKPLFLLDACIVLVSLILEIYFHFSNFNKSGRTASAFVILRLWKIVRALHAVAHSISLRNRLIVEKIQQAFDIVREENDEANEELEKQQIKIEYLMESLQTTGTKVTHEQLDKYVKTKHRQRKYVTTF
ncbi:unnamed protein product [Rotaria sordida]|uniref:Voltage-gated hydrogen channel 1 n=1 Tax=Rotaria sordida TaxID=392033 RepID=A0A814SHN9_9BILA|nr:unnamed protein product [Rotaria sordida]CAF1383924.1 unnamed protein product [Rotaria sordida]